MCSSTLLPSAPPHIIEWIHPFRAVTEDGNPASVRKSPNQNLGVDCEGEKGGQASSPTRRPEAVSRSRELRCFAVTPYGLMYTDRSFTGKKEEGRDTNGDAGFKGRKWPKMGLLYTDIGTFELIAAANHNSHAVRCLKTFYKQTKEKQRKMPKTKAPKPKLSTPKAGSRSKTKPRQTRSVGGLPTLDEILDLPDELELARGPLLRVRFPTLGEDSDDDEMPEIPQTREELRRLYKPFPKLEVYNDQGESLFEGPIQVLDYIHIRAGEVGGESVEDTEQWYGQITYIGARDPPATKTRKAKGEPTEEQEQPDVCLRIAWFYDHGSDVEPTIPDARGQAILFQHDSGRADIFRPLRHSSLVVIARQSVQFSETESCLNILQKTSVPPAANFHTNPTETSNTFAHESPVAGDWMIDYELPPEELQLVDIVSSRKSGKPNQNISNFEHSSETEGEADGEDKNSLQRRLVLVRQLPPLVRSLATSAITRGIDSGQGIVGGAYVIQQARWLARKVVIEGGTLTREEEEDLAEEAKLTNPDGGPKLTQRKYLCPACSDPI
ncbi:hypothetical protein RHS04_07327 [Rhizoctonia solani]|uniref:BAH domain-containing protein n=1 Tax=Rhizoctonia solani TaxID=456999 RepID=A0A8H7LHG1_9AGAM|nr:hypothetical protein RHS04_07327 [Rhizoctonia solani]